MYTFVWFSVAIWETPSKKTAVILSHLYVIGVKIVLRDDMRAWNALSQDIRDALSLGSFKKKLKIPTIFPLRYFDMIQLSREVDKALACRSSGTGFELRSRRNLLNRKRGSFAHSLLLLPYHRPDMNEILLKRT